MTVNRTTPAELRAELEVLVPGGPPDPLELAAAVGNKEAEKYDQFLSEDLLNAEFAARALDPAGAWSVLERALEDLRATRR